MSAFPVRVLGAALVFCASLILSASDAFATHARGGTVTWTRGTQTATHTEFRITYTAGFRWSFPWNSSGVNHCLAIAGFVPSSSTVGGGSCAPVGTILPAGSVGQISFFLPLNTSQIGLPLTNGGSLVSGVQPQFRIDKTVAAQDQMYASYSFSVWVPRGGGTTLGARIRWQVNARLSTLLQGNNDTLQQLETLVVHTATRSPEAIMTAIVPVTTGVQNVLAIPVSSEPGTNATLSIAPQPQSLLPAPVPPNFTFSNASPNTILFTPPVSGLYAVQLNVTSSGNSSPRAAFEFLLDARPNCVGSSCRKVDVGVSDDTPSVEVGDTLTFAVNASASNLAIVSPATTLSIENTPLPVSMNVSGTPVSAIAPALGRVYNYSWTPTQAEIGSYPVCFQGLTTQLNNGPNNMMSVPKCVVFNVVEHNDPPALQCSAPITVAGLSPLGTNTSVQALFSDPDVDALVLSWKVNGGAAGFTNFTPNPSEQTAELPFDFPIGVNTVEATVSDGVDSVSCTTTVTVNRIAQAVVFSPPSPVAFGTPTVSLNASAPGGAVTFALMSGPATLAGNVLTITGLGEIVVQATAAATAIYEPGSATASIVVADMTAPAITVPGTITAEATGPGGAAVAYSTSVSDDVDTGLAAVCAPASGSTFPVGSTTVSCSAVDAAGNEGAATFTVSVADTTAPEVEPALNVNAEATGAAGAVVTFASPASSDLVSGPGAASCDPASGSMFAIGSTAVSCTAFDAAGNSASTTFTVAVSDTTPPAIAAHANLVAEAAGATGAVVSWTDPTAVDLVDGATAVSCAPASGSLFSLGTSTVTCTSADSTGNSGSSAFSVFVGDTAAPLVATHGSESVEATSASGAVVVFTAPSFTDLVDGTGAATCAPASGSTFAIGATTVTCSATDAAGNTGSSAFSVTVSDTTPPTIAVPGDLIPPATSAAGAVVTYTAPATSDLVDGAGLASCLPASGSLFPMGLTTVTCTATDARGNSAAPITFTVTITNNAPTFTPPAAITAEAANASGATVTFSASGQDIEDGPIAAVCSPASGSVFPIGTTTVSCTVTDVASASASGSFTVAVADTIAPVVTYTGNAGAYSVTETVNISCAATDAVGVVSSTCAPVSGPAYSFATGVNTFTATATDAAGNIGTGTASFTVTASLVDVQSLVNAFSSNAGVSNGLNAKLQAAESAANANARAGQLGAFVNQVQAQIGKSLTAQEAAVLLQLVQAFF